jgi:hypothetical protein
MFDGGPTQCKTASQFPQTSLINPLKLRIFLYEIPAVILETLIVKISLKS